MSSLAVVTEQTEVEVSLRATAQELCESASSVTIFTRNDLSEATDLVKAIKTRARDIEDERTRLVRPFNDGVKAINARFKAMSEPLLSAENELKGKMLAFQKEEERRANEEAMRLEKLRIVAEEKARQEREAEEAQMAKESPPESGDIRSMPLPITVPVIAAVAPAHRPTTYGQTGAVSTVKKVWTFDLTDIKALAIARPDLIMVDTVKINQEIRGKGGMIAGLNIYEKEVMQVR